MKKTLLALGLIATFMVLLSLSSGDFRLTPGQVLTAIFVPGDGFERIVVLQWRMPRVLLALLLGAALGVSGAIFQSLTRNPLGSPDIIGFNSGAYTGALLVLTASGSAYVGVAAGALAGGIATAVVVYALAYRGGVQGFRLIVVGIAISAMLFAVNTWLILRARLEEAMAAAVWGIGSLNAVGWTQAVPVIVLLTALTPALTYYARPMKVMEMGDESAIALGVPVERTRRMLVFIGVSLTAISVAAAGPITFVALAAPQIAKKLTRTPHIAMVPSAATGAVLLIVSDWIAQHAFGDIALPVGSVTVCIGGVYLLWLLSREVRKQ